MPSPNEAEASGIMKQRRGTKRGVRRTAAQWQELIERFEREGQTRGGFCAAHGIALSTFDLWRRKRRGTSAVTEEEPQALFVELSSPPVLKTQVPPASTGTGLWEVELELGAWCCGYEGRRHAKRPYHGADLAVYGSAAVQRPIGADPAAD